jgi:hypothetical protein
VDDSPLVRTLAAVLTLAGLAIMTWMELPAWQRELVTRAARLRTRSLATRLARASGHRAMGRELAGVAEDEAGYRRTFRLSTLRDKL